MPYKLTLEYSLNDSFNENDFKHLEQCHRITNLKEQLEQYKEALKRANNSNFLNPLNKGGVCVKDLDSYSMYEGNIAYILETEEEKFKEALTKAKSEGFKYLISYAIDLDQVKSIKDKPIKKVINLYTGKEINKPLNCFDIEILELQQTPVNAFKCLSRRYHLEKYLSDEGIEFLKDKFLNMNPKEIYFYFNEYLESIEDITKDKAINSFSAFINKRINLIESHYQELNQDNLKAKELLEKYAIEHNLSEDDINKLLNHERTKRTEETLKALYYNYLAFNKPTEKDLIKYIFNNLNAINDKEEYLYYLSAFTNLLTTGDKPKEYAISENKERLELITKDKYYKMLNYCFNELLSYRLQEQPTEIITKNNLSLLNNRLTMFLQNGIGLNISNLSRTNKEKGEEIKGIYENIQELEKNKNDININDAEENFLIDEKIKEQRKKLSDNNIIIYYIKDFILRYEDRKNKGIPQTKADLFFKEMLENGEEINFLINKTNTQLIDIGDTIIIKNPNFNGFEAKILKYDFINYFKNSNTISKIIIVLLNMASNCNDPNIIINNADIKAIYNNDKDYLSRFKEDIETIYNMTFAYENEETGTSKNKIQRVFNSRLIDTFIFNGSEIKLILSTQFYQATHTFKALSYYDKGILNLSTTGRELSTYLYNQYAVIKSHNNESTKLNKTTLLENTSLPTKEQLRYLGTKHISRKINDPLEDAIEEIMPLFNIEESEEAIERFAPKNQVSEKDFKEQTKKNKKKQ